MSNLDLREGDKACSDTQNHQIHCTTSIKVRTRLATNQIFADKSLAPNSGDGDSNARMSTGRFTGSYVERVGHIQSSQLAGVNISSVVSAGSLRSPGVDLLSLYLDIHRVSSANFLDSIPADRDLSQRISDGNSFIEEGHLGANEAQVKDVRDQNRPTDCDHNATRTLTKETLRSNASAEDVDGPGKEVTTSRAVHLSITHTSSLSRKVMR